MGEHPSRNTAIHPNQCYGLWVNIPAGTQQYIHTSVTDNGSTYQQEHSNTSTPVLWAVGEHPSRNTAIHPHQCYRQLEHIPAGTQQYTHTSVTDNGSTYQQEHSNTSTPVLRAMGEHTSRNTAIHPHQCYGLWVNIPAGTQQYIHTSVTGYG